MSVETSDLDEAREICGEHMYPRTLRLVDRQPRLAARFAFLHLGGLTLGDVRYGAQVAGDCGELGSYHVNLPLAGTFAAVHDGRPISGNTSRAGVYRPVGTNVLLSSSADCHLLALKVNTTVLEAKLAGLLDAPVRGPLRLAGQLDVRRSPGRDCAGLMRLIGAEIDNTAGLIYHPIVAAPLEESLLIGLLYAVDHQYQDLLHRPQSRLPHRQVKRAIDAIHAEPQRPYTIAALARIADVSLGCLQREFHRQVGLPPMAYLRKVRMARAHAELVGADPAETSVTDVARRWGFPRPDRFTRRYLACYGVAPTEALHGTAGTDT